MKRLWARLHVRILVIILVISAIAAGVQYFQISQHRERDLANAMEREALQTAQMVAEEYEQLVNEAHQLLTILASVPAVADGSPHLCGEFLNHVVQGNPRYLNLGVVGVDGHLTCSARPHHFTVNLADRPYFQRALLNRKFAVGGFQVGRLTGQRSINFGYPLLDDAGEVRAVLFSALDLDWLNRLADQSQMAEGGTLTVLDDTGTVLARYPDGEDWIGRSLRHLPAVQRILTEGSGLAIDVGADGTRRLYGYQKLRNDPGTGEMYVYVSIPEAVALSDVRVRTQMLLWQVLISSAAGVAAWAWAGVFLVRPLRALLAAARRLSAGELAARSGLRPGPGELGELAGAFDEMAESLEQRYRQLQSLADTGGTLGATLELRAVLEGICREAQQVLKADAVSVLQPGHDTADWRILASRGLSEAYVAEAQIPEAFIRLPMQVQPRPVICFDDLASALPERAQAYRREGIRAALVALMHHQDEPVGALVAYGKTPGRRFAPEDQAAALTIAEMAAAALANARLYAQARNRLEHLQALREIDLAILNSANLQDTLEIVTEQGVSQLQVDAAAVWLLEGEQPSLNLAAARGVDAATTLDLDMGSGDSPDPLAGVPAQGLLVPDLGSGEPAATIHVSGTEPFTSALLVPLRTNDRTLGLLGLFHRSRLTPDREWLDFAAALGGQAAIAVGRAELLANLQQANADLIVSYDATLEGWSRALDLRDEETSGHTGRVTEGTLRLARAMGLGTGDLAHIRRGALLHDVGKLGIPDSILRKPGPLSDAEWVIMKQHPVIAYEWLRPISFLRPALDIPYCHHEKWDGTGYPRGLRGEEIPLAARIFAVVDVWDALRSDRPYRRAWPAERVRDHISAQAGSHFDPDVVDVFLRLLESTP